MSNATNETTNKRKLVDFDQLYPGRFLKAGELLGRKVTLTITAVEQEELQGDDGQKKEKAILSFKETSKKHVCCKTNGICIREMFGRKLPEWIGKRIVVFPDIWNGEPAIRIWGSPDIAQDIDVEVALPRRRPFRKTMHAIAARGAKAEPPPAPPQGDATSDADPDDDGRSGF